MLLFTDKLKFFLLLSCCISLSLHASWWWPFGKKKAPEKPTVSDVDKRPPIKVSDRAPSKEDTVSVERLQKLAKDGNSNAQLALGKIYFEGLVGQKQDYDKAFELFTQSADQGNPQAMFNIGLCYEGGFGVKKNPKEALRWYYQAADAGVPEAQINAAVAAEQRGDYEKALHYLKIRANAGDTAAMNKVASFLLNGLGTPENPQEAVSYLLEASRRGNSRAQVRLADCYQRGVGVERNYLEMFNWLTLAAQDGDPEAQAKLGYCYQKGLGIAANSDLAFTWFKTAAG
ncbi:MAG: sel1 repeat family protein, partial [Lentisphaerae bacterium]|nr:sel1 repeat family protein [Lentisphaerota bacterium]